MLGSIILGAEWLFLASMAYAGPLAFVVPNPRSTFPVRTSQRGMSRQPFGTTPMTRAPATRRPSSQQKADDDLDSKKSSRKSSAGPEQRPRLPAASTKRVGPTTRTSRPDADMSVLVPVKDLVSVSLTDLSRAAADSLGGGEAVSVSMERFCKTLEGVFRTELSVKVDRAKAASVLGGRRYGSSAAAGASTNDDDSNNHDSSSGVTSEESINGNGDAAVALAAGEDEQKIARSNKRWRKVLKPWDTNRGNAVNQQTEGVSTAAAEGVRSWRRGIVVRRGKNGHREKEERIEMTPEEKSVPLLQLVEELVRNAMYRPISDRDVMMSQALAAEFPTAARVRPVYGNMASIYDLVHHRPEQDSVRNGRRGSNKEGKGTEDEVAAEVPFEGRLLVFTRGNGMEETTGRLLLKKLDYLQSNAVGWLSESVTDSIKGFQEQLVTVVESCVRDLAKRKDGVVRSCVEGGIAFGLERDTLARFLPVSDETELSLKEQEALEEALESLRNNARRGPANLQRRYGMRDVGVELGVFSEDGAWPPRDDSWFWDTQKVSDAGEHGEEGGSLDVAKGKDDDAIAAGEGVPSAVLSRVTLKSVLSPRAVDLTEGDRALRRKNEGKRSAQDSRSASKSFLSRLLSRCTIREPTYDEVVVVYYKNVKRSAFRPPPTLSSAWKIATKLTNRIRGVEKVDSEEKESDEGKGAGLGLQLRVYRGVPIVNLNAITPDKKVVVRPQTALRLDLNTLVGLGLVLANLRFDSPVLVVAATVSVILLVVKTVVGYLNARVRVESFVSRDILDKTMGSNVPVLRHLAEEAAQQKSRHVALVYAALLQCALDDSFSDRPLGQDRREDDSGSVTAVSMASVSRHCGVMMKACVGLPWEAKVDVPYWLREMEKLKILARADTERDDGRTKSKQGWLPLALEGPGATGAAPTTKPTATTAPNRQEPTPTTTPPSALPSEDDGRSSTVVLYRLLDPDAAVEELRLRWAELVEPPQGDYAEPRDDEGGTPWARR